MASVFDDGSMGHMSTPSRAFFWSAGKVLEGGPTRWFDAVCLLITLLCTSMFPRDSAVQLCFLFVAARA